jgi:hypothetical protein
VHGLETIEIKSMTAKEEDIMINDSFIEKGIVFERLIDSIIVTPGIKSDHLIDCDKVAILVAARRSGYGDLVAEQDQWQRSVSQRCLREQQQKSLRSKAQTSGHTMNQVNSYHLNCQFLD